MGYLRWLMARVSAKPSTDPPPASDDRRAIGVFDSGIGGLSVLRHLRRQLPRERFVYIADSARAPYGGRPADEIVAFSREIVARLVDEYDCKLVVVACNTATAAAAKTLRAERPDLPIVGMEPAVKPAAAATRSGHVGVMATAGTLSSAKYAALLRTHGQGLHLHDDPCVGLVALIEAGHLDGPVLRQRLREIIHPMRARGVDTIVLGCTHFPLIETAIREVAGPDVTIVDPAPAVARYVGEVLRKRNLARASEPTGPHFLLSSGTTDASGPKALAAYWQRLTEPVADVDYVVGPYHAGVDARRESGTRLRGAT